MQPENIDYEDLKNRGFLRQKQDGFFVLRTRMTSGVYTKEALGRLAEISQKFGKGFVHATTRQSLEIPFIKYDDIPAAEELGKKYGIMFGTSGARLRTTTVCPGNNWCKSGLVNTFNLADRIEKELGIKCGLMLPHKFKIAISGCPNTCTRPQATEIGIHGQIDTTCAERRVAYAVYVGGCGGRLPRTGFKLDKLYGEDEVLIIVKNVVNFFKAKAKARQRLALLIEETGKDNFLKAVLV